MKSTIFSTFAALALLTACGSKSDTQSIPTVKPAQKTAMASPGAQSASPDAPPPPAPVASAPAAPVEVSAPSGAAPTTAPATGDPLAVFRRDAEGKTLNDLEALQAAADAYGRRADISDDPAKPAWPNLKVKDLSVMVEVGFLKALPTPPDGQKYVMDKQTMKVKLVSK